MEAVIFDLDGVLADTARGHYLAWLRLADELGIPFDEAANEDLKGVSREASLEIILRRGSGPFDAAKKRELMARKNGYYQEIIAGMTPRDLLPGAREAVDDCRRHGLRVGLASASKNAPAVLRRLEIATLFDYVADAAGIRHPKPDPEIFLTSAAGLGVAAAKCIGVEDAAAGVQAIRSAGMFAIGVGDPNILGEADQVIPSIAEFRIADYLHGGR